MSCIATQLKSNGGRVCGRPTKVPNYCGIHKPGGYHTKKNRLNDSDSVSSVSEASSDDWGICKFHPRCSRTNCRYEHPKDQTTSLCRHFPHCQYQDCKFYHPVETKVNKTVSVGTQTVSCTTKSSSVGAQTLEVSISTVEVHCFKCSDVIEIDSECDSSDYSEFECETCDETKLRKKKAAEMRLKGLALLNEAKLLLEK